MLSAGLPGWFTRARAGRILIAGYYLLLVIVLVSFRPSPFLLLMSLWIELALLLIILVFFLIRSRCRHLLERIAAAIMAGVLFLSMQYLLVFIAARDLGDPYLAGLGSWILQPVKTLALPLSLMLLSLVPVYAVMVYRSLERNDRIYRIQTGINFQALLLWSLTLLAFIFARIFGAMDQMQVIIGIGALRAGIQPLLSNLQIE